MPWGEVARGCNGREPGSSLLRNKGRSNHRVDTSRRAVSMGPVARLTIKDNMNRLIQCGDGSWAPSCAVCVHIVEGAADSVVRIVNEGPGQDDYIRAECAAAVGRIDVGSLCTVCIHCARRLVEGLKEVG